MCNVFVNMNMEILQTHTKLVRNSIVRLKITNMQRNEILKSMFDRFQPDESLYQMMLTNRR